MNKIYLPNLKSINIKNFSLYPNALDFTYDFIEGVNLIVGGNGVGKTTFISLIKYALIGLYRKHKDSKRYLEKKIVKREQFSEEFFRNRMNKEFRLNSEAKVTITFTIRDVTFIVTRNLYDIQLEKVVIKENDIEYKLEGAVIKQHKYEKLDEEEKVDYLQFLYEQRVAKEANLYEFDDLIFFINEILVFGENRKTILWDSDLQEQLSSKYFNDPELDNRYRNLKMDAKYYDSLSRHKSEDIRAVNLVLEKIRVDNTEEQKDIDVIKKINELKSSIERKSKSLTDIQNERQLLETKLKLKSNEKTMKIKEQQEIENRIRNEEKLIYKELWEDLNPEYHIYKKYIIDNKSCPLCNTEIEHELYNYIIHNEGKCILCHKEIKNSETEPTNIKDLKVDMENILINIQNIEREIYRIEDNLKSLDIEFNNTRIRINDLQSKLRNLEFKLNSEKKSDQKQDSLAIRRMLDQIDELEKEKYKFLDESKKCNEMAKNIAKQMDDERVQITTELTEIFGEFAGSFLKVQCQLTYDNLDGKGSRYNPKIKGSVRLYPEELSESQCFFVDHSFRMSLLRLFYTAPAFFICETPESSLDISYEINAANIFLKYLDKPNSLILTSNLNNSKFLEYIIENAPRISFINLLKIGDPTMIQRESSSLIEISDRIEGMINGRVI